MGMEAVVEGVREVRGARRVTKVERAIDLVQIVMRSLEEFRNL